MKRIFLLIFIIVHISSIAQSVPNDIKEYGFNGKVKSVYNVYFSNINKVANKWVLDKNKISIRSTMWFNCSGNIDSITWVNDQYGEQTKTITRFYHTGNQKTSLIKQNSESKIFEEGTYNWIDNQNYTISVTNSDGSHIESFSNLNSDFRDISGGYMLLVDDLVIVSEKYSNKLDPSGLIKSYTNTDLLKNKTTTYILTEIELDAFGNLMNFACIDKESGDLTYYLKRVFTYYE